MKRMKQWMLALPLVLGLASCSLSEDNPVVTPDQPEQPTKQEADYTILYYGNGGGNLDPMLVSNMLSLFIAEDESYDNVKICAQYKYSTLENMEDLIEEVEDYVDPSDAEQVEFLEQVKALKAYAGKTFRFAIDGTPDLPVTDDGDIDINDPHELFGQNFLGDNADVTSVDSLVNFINWASATCPAKKYILVLSDHGGGFLPNDEAAPTARVRTRGVMYDDGLDDRHFTARTLAQAIGQAKVRPAAVYLDACLMNGAEYQFELAPVTDYLVLSTFVVPGAGGDYLELINALSQNPNDLETALARFAKATVTNWDEEAEDDEWDDEWDDDDDEGVYHDMSVYRTAAISALGQEIKKFVDLLVDAYQNGDEETREKIDVCTANAFRVNDQYPYYDLLDYCLNLTLVLPNVFGSAFESPLGQAFDRTIVYQQSSRWLQDNDVSVDLSVLLGCDGHYTLTDMERGIYKQYNADGTNLLYFLALGDDDDDATTYPGTWSSTLDAVYGQTRFDQATGWSRWLKANQMEPNFECSIDFNPFLIDVDDDDDLDLDLDDDFEEARAKALVRHCTRAKARTARARR